MADLAVWQRTIVDEEGNVIPGAEIEVRREEDDSLAMLYADRAGETPLANPLAADMSGFVRFFAQGDAYTITAVGAGSTRTWRFDPTGRLQEFDRVSEALVADDAADLLSARSNLGTFSTVADVQASHIPPVLASIRTNGYHAPGDGGGAQLVESDPSDPAARPSADGRWWAPAIPNSRKINAEVFGVLFDQRTPEELRDALQTAFNWCAPRGVDLILPSGVGVISDYLEVPSHLRVFGQGMYATILQASDQFPEDSNMLQPADFDMSVGYVLIADLTLDGNRDARVAAGTVTGVGSVRPGASGWASMSAHDCLLQRVRSIGQVLHCFDDCAGGVLRGDGKRSYQFPTGPEIYSDTPSRNNVYYECVAEDWGDDGFTAHYSVGGQFIRCKAIGGSEYYSDNLDGSCCFELDDGSLGYTIRECVAEGSARGIIAKAHDGQPTASIITIVDNVVTGCGVGISVVGHSESIGHDYVITGNKVRDPVQLPGRTIDMHGYRIASVKGVFCVSNEAIAPQGVQGLGSGFYIVSESTGVFLDDYYVENWPGDESNDPTVAAVRVAADSDVLVGKGRIIRPGGYGISWTGSYVSPRSVGPVTIIGSDLPNSVGIYTTALWGDGVVTASIRGFTYPFQDSGGQRGSPWNHMGEGLRVRGGFSLGPQKTLTINNGEITVGDGAFFAVDTEGGAATDDLTAIHGGHAGDIIVLKSATSQREVVVKDAYVSGESRLQIAGDFTLSSSSDMLVLMHNGSWWVELSRSTNV